MKLNILIVDDEQHVREGIALKIEDKDHKIGCIDQAEDGYMALEMFGQKKHYDICIMDIKMPEMDGLDTIVKAKENGVECNYIIVSGYDDFEYARRAIKLGVVDYLLKPVNADQLNELIDQVRCSIDVSNYIKDVSSESSTTNLLSNAKLNDILWRDNEGNIKAHLKELESLFTKDLSRVLVLHFRSLEEGKGISLSDLSGLIRHKIEQTNQECQLAIMEHQSHKKNELAIIMNFNKGNDELSILQYLIRLLIREYGIEVAIGIGEVKKKTFFH